MTGFCSLKIATKRLPIALVCSVDIALPPYDR
jgi:hypothetical protein